MAGEKLHLKWNDFQNLAQASFQDLRNNNDFTDVTLVCEDQSIKAHKVILSACSLFFKKLLSNNPHSHPLIYVKGVSSSSLTAVTNFLYLGESSILHEELYSFLALAKEFQLRGLDGSYEEKKLESRHRFIATKSSTEFNQAKHIPQRKISNFKLDVET